MNVLLHNLALAQRASHAVRDMTLRQPLVWMYGQRAPRAMGDDFLTLALDALTSADLAHMAAHSRPVAEVSR